MFDNEAKLHEVSFNSSYLFSSVLLLLSFAAVT